MGDPGEDELGEILNRHAANLRSLALAERRYSDRAADDDIGAAVRPAVDRDIDRASDGRFAWHDRFLTGAAGRCRRRTFAKVSAYAPQLERLTSCQRMTGCQRDMISLRMRAWSDCCAGSDVILVANMADRTAAMAWASPWEIPAPGRRHELLPVFVGQLGDALQLRHRRRHP